MLYRSISGCIAYVIYRGISDCIACVIQEQQVAVSYPSVDDLFTPNGSGSLDATGVSLLFGACSHGALCAWIEAKFARPLHKLQSECKDFRRSQWMAAGGVWNPAA